jgi:uncharacterized membrane protein
MEQNRLLSPVVWSAIAGQVLALLMTLGVISTGVSEAIDSLVASLLQLLVAFGVLNNPTSKTSF